jgi:hypothetical protein
MLGEKRKRRQEEEEEEDCCNIMLLADVILNCRQHLAPCYRQHSYKNMCPADEHEQVHHAGTAYL